MKKKRASKNTMPKKKTRVSSGNLTNQQGYDFGIKKEFKKDDLVKKNQSLMKKIYKKT